MTTSQRDPLDLLAATFIVQTLEIDLPAGDLVAGLNRIERDDDTAVYAVQLDSSVGPAAFLVYAYRAASAARNKRTRQTQDRYETDLQTLREAQSRNVPGPRLVATGDLERHSFILATDPQTFAALTGQAGGNGVLPVATPDATSDPAGVRRDAAERLIPLLRDAETQAGRWLSALAAQRAASGQTGAPITLDDVETELALRIIGPGGMRNILTFANQILERSHWSPDEAAPNATSPSSSRNNAEKAGPGDEDA